MVEKMVISMGPGFQPSLLVVHLSFGYLVCSVKGFPGKGRHFLDPLKAGQRSVWGETQPVSAAAWYSLQLSCHNSLYPSV